MEYKSTAALPYVKGLSEQLRRCLQQQGIRAIFQSETTLRSHLVRLKDVVEPTKQDGVVYAVKSTLVRLEDPCKIESKNMSETSDLPVPRPPPFQNTLTTPDTTRFRTK